VIVFILFFASNIYNAVRSAISETAGFPVIFHLVALTTLTQLFSLQQLKNSSTYTIATIGQKSPYLAKKIYFS